MCWIKGGLSRLTSGGSDREVSKGGRSERMERLLRDGSLQAWVISHVRSLGLGIVYYGVRV